MVRWGVALWLAAAVLAQADEPPPLSQVGPQSGSDAARAARPTTPEPALVFDLRSEEDGAPAKTRTLTVTLTSTYTATADGRTHELDDRTLCRTFLWMDHAPQVANGSCYAVPVFKANELQNRMGIAAIMKAAKLDKSPVLTNAYWPQAELGVAPPGAPPPLAVSTRGDVTEYRLGDTVVARLVGAAAPLDPDERARFIRFAARHLPLHPQVRSALAASPTLPARIEVQVAHGAELKRMVFTLSAVRRLRADYPLPPGLTSTWRSRPEGDADFAAGVASALAAADGRSHPPSLETLVARVQDAGTHGRGLEAILAYTDITLQYPKQAGGANARAFADPIRLALTTALQDPQAMRFEQAAATAGGPHDAGDRQEAARWLAEQTGMDAVPFGVFRYVTYANLVMGSKDADKWDSAILKAMPRSLTSNYWRAIASYPWASGFYKDCGVAYVAGFDTERAWLAFDLGRAIDPQWRSGPLGAVPALEQRIRADQPDFF